MGYFSLVHSNEGTDKKQHILLLEIHKIKQNREEHYGPWKTQERNQQLTLGLTVYKNYLQKISLIMPFISKADLSHNQK